MTRFLIIAAALAAFPDVAAAEVPGWEAERERARALPAWCAGDPVELDAEILALARVCAHEAGYESPSDCRLMREVHERLAVQRGVSYLAEAWSYSPRALSGRSGRAWFAEMGPWCRQPPSWPGGGSWARLEALWVEHLDVAARVVLAEQKLGPEPCIGTVHDWGCSDCGDAERAIRLGLVPVWCRDTVNDFYARPTIRRREAAAARRARLRLDR